MKTRFLFKMLNLVLVSVLLSGLVLTASPVQNAQAANYSAGSYAELVNAINAANGSIAEADVITLTDNITLTAALPQITSEITIEGDSYKLDGDHAYPVLSVSGMGNLTVNQVTIANGFSTGDGGGISCLFGSLTVISSTITGNSASNGAGIYHLNPGSLTIQGSTISDNTATTSGGGVFAPVGSVVVTGSTFSGNSAIYGGGLSNPVSISINNSSFTGNSATGDGGGIYNSGAPSVLMLDNVAFSGNLASDSGGGIFNSGGHASLEKVSLSGNSAVYGGGIFNNVNSNVVLTNTIVLGNLASNDGGGLFNGGIFTVTNSTISGNQAQLGRGGGAYNSSSSMLFQNVILWNNQDLSGTGTLTSTIFNDSASPSVRYSDLQGCGGSDMWDASCGTDGGNNIDGDPSFDTPVDPANAPTTDGDVHVPGSSLTVDTGDDGVCPSDDFDGETRPQGAACDQGAFETVGSPTVDAGLDQTVDEGDEVGFDGSVNDSVLISGMLADNSYHWDFGDGFTITGTLTPTHTYVDNGTYSVTLTVTNTYGGVGSDLLTITVENIPPKLSEFPDQTGWVGEIVTVTGTITDPGMLDSQTVRVEWGDGEISIQTLGAAVRQFAVGHSYAITGQYAVDIVVTDKDGGFDVKSFWMNIGMKIIFPIHFVP